MAKIKIKIKNRYPKRPTETSIISDCEKVVKIVDSSDVFKYGRGMETILHHLKELGLSEKQARVYAALVEIGEGTAYAVAKQAKVKRPTVYVLLDELRLRGLVLKVPHAKKQVFIAKNPDELFVEQEEKLRFARRALPELLARAARGASKVKTYFFEGTEGVKQALHYKQKEIAGKELLAYYAKSERGARSIPKFYLDYEQMLVNQKTEKRMIVPLHASLADFRRLDKLPGRKTIALPEGEFSSKVSVEIADSFVRIILHRDSQALIVENKDFAEMMKQVFEIVWKAKIKRV